ncbi:soleucyl-trna synthetase [Holotrichia oblita]|uniref:Soleucyl-trna synthetase n=1 Tax=Holotrichia oblita TaxID=644536 RepID=A0ACB9TJC0_HOLOL|nr:soleucyl-trna synthetase [Holotrichia oblita]
MSTHELKQIPRVPETINFSDAEEITLNLWKKINAFQTCLKQSKGKPRYSFYDGPPFATGLPHYGHILAGTIKDVVTRYAHQQGYHVERRFGWDCHGLPVEYEIDKTLNIKGPDDVMKMGIATYNAECRKIVSRYSGEWEIIMERLGRWIDFKRDYKTMYPWFMESVWWIFKQLYNKGFVYQGNKVMPYSTACSTPLSNFESGQNYKDVVDPAVTVTLPIIGDKDYTCLLIWTTTPWTLPSNLAACVNPNLEYVKVKQISTRKYFIVMEARLEVVFQPNDYEIVDKFPGIKLKGLRYEPIFPFFKERCKDVAFRVLTDEYVTSESGTGIVHQAAYFGEDDYRVCLANNVITRDQEPICPLDASGRFVNPVTDFEGQYVKDADKNIIAALKANGRMFHVGQVKHSYPFCWRSETPLIYRAVPSWFIRVEQMVDDLLKSSADTYWVPEFVKDKRFGNWLRDARDWAVSRNRYWGTPIPLWVSPTGDEFVCVGSIAELEELTGTKVTDLHRENIDHLEIPSRIPGNPPLRRVTEVFDCWFESGSMPYAQQHYPFENVKEFEDAFPADFIAEGIDQTRGWFYTLIVISTAIFGKAPFKNLIANGLVLASDGQKMSKSKKNFPNPMDVVHKYGADALRLYLISSPVVRAENLRFKEEGVRDIIKDVFLPWYNAFRFLMQSVECYVQDNKESFVYSEKSVGSTNIMDKWILSFTQSLLLYVRKEMALYHLYNVIPRLTKYIDYLTNWYVRMNRKRLKGENGKEDCKQCIMTLFNVIFNIIRMMSPFSPFLCETMYQYLKELLQDRSDSVHYLMLPQANQDLIEEKIERAVSRMQTVIELGRVIRDRKTMPIKYPLPEVIVVHQNPEYLADVESLKSYVLSELNVRSLKTTMDKTKYGITLRAEPDHKTLGLRLKQHFKAVTLAIKDLTDDQINEFVRIGYRDIVGQRIELSEIRLIFKTDLASGQYEVHSDNDVLVLLDCTPDSSMQDEGTAREIINRIQKLRKKAHLVPTDEITVFYKTEGELKRVAESFQSFIEETIKASIKPFESRQKSDGLIMEETQTLKNCELTITLTKTADISAPKVKWINVELVDLTPRYCNNASKGLILLETGNGLLTVAELKRNISSLFGIENFDIYTSTGEVVVKNLDALSGQTIFVGRKPISPKQMVEGVPFCKVSNFNEDGVVGTLILENPKGVSTNVDKCRTDIINRWVKNKSTNK